MTKVIRRYLVVPAMLLAMSGYASAQGYTRSLYDRSFPMTARQIDSLLAIAGPQLTRAQSRGLQNDTSYASLLETIGRCRLGQSRLVEAESLLTAALSIRQAQLGDDHARVASALLHLGDCQFFMGNVEAEKTLRRCVAIRERHSGEDELALMTALDHLAALYLHQGRRADAQALITRAMEICARYYPTDHPAWATLIIHLSDSYFFASWRKNDSLYRTAAEMLERAYGSDDLDFATALWAWGFVESMIQLRPPSGATHHRQTFEIRRRHLPPGSQDLYMSAITCMNFQTVAGMFAAAESTLTIIDSLIVPYPQGDHLVCLAQMSVGLFEATGQMRRALEATWKSFRYHRKHRDPSVGYMNEEDMLSRGGAFRYGQSMYVSYFLDLDSRTGVDSLRAIEAMLEGKGWITEAMIRRRQTARQSDEAEVARLVDSIALLRHGVSSLFVRGALADSSTALFREFDETVARRNELELQLAEALPARLTQRVPDDSLAAWITQSLPEGTALVEYGRLDYRLNWANPKYMAVVLKKGSPPVIFDLGWTLDVDSMIIHHYKPHFDQLIENRRPPNNAEAAEFRGISDAITARLWTPISAAVGDAKTVVVSPEGSMNALSFASLLQNGEYLIERHAIHYVNSGRDLIRLSEQRAPKQTLMVVADPEFTAMPVAQAGSGDRYDSEGWEVRSIPVQCDGLVNLSLSRLPGSSREAKVIVEAWELRHGNTYSVHTGSAANEQSVLANMDKAQVVHIATHGYATDIRCGPVRLRKRDEFGIASESAYMSETPMLMSGLLLARTGATIGANDGVMTADEVRTLNLDGTELVILSGCETAQGPSRHSDGVYGLRRAFQFAGVRTVISALWSIPDRETPELMREIYASDATDYPTVMREVALKRIRYARENGLPEHPLVWGAFVAVGDWKKSW